MMVCPVCVGLEQGLELLGCCVATTCCQKSFLGHGFKTTLKLGKRYYMKSEVALKIADH